MNDQQIAGLWRLLSQTWGARFLEQYGDRPNEAWTSFLVNVDADAARFAFRAIVLEGSAFPPTLPEFIAASRRYRREQALRERSEAALLPLPTVDSAEARERLASIRRLLAE